MQVWKRAVDMGWFGRNPTPPSGGLWKTNPGRQATQSKREAKNDAVIDRHKQDVAVVERKRERDERRTRRQSKGPFHHPGKHPHSNGHKHPKDMTKAEQRAHGIVVTKGWFGSYTVRTRTSVVGETHDYADEIAGINSDISSLKRTMGKKGADRKGLAKEIARLTARRTTLHSKAKRMHRIL